MEESEKKYKLEKASDLEKEGKLLHALQLYTAVNEEYPSERKICIKIASVYEKLKNIEKADLVLKKYLENNSDDHEIRRFYAHFLVRNNLYERALEELQNLSVDEYGELHFLTGLSNYRLDNLKASVLNFKNFIKYNPKSELLPEAYLYLSKCSLMSQSYSEALNYAKKSEELFNISYDLFITKTSIFYSKEMYYHALEALRKAADFGRETEETDLWYSKIYVKTEDWDKAKKYLDLLLKKNIKTSEVNILLGKTLFGKREVEQAELYFKKALSENPSNKEAKAGINKCYNIYLKRMNESPGNNPA